jgi:vacuolar-type H+-ATPase subunit H
MTTDLESRLKAAIEKARPVIETLVADLEREATIIKERDLDPRKLADEPIVQDARSAAVDALENLTAFAKSLYTMVKNYVPDIDKHVDVDALKEQLAGAPGRARSRVESSNGHGVTDRLKETGEDAKARLETTAHEGRERVDDAAQKSKEHVSAAAQKGKDGTAEMLAALGWAAAAGTVIYVVFMDEKRRRQAKSVAKAAGNGLLVVVNSASKKS